MAPTRLLPPAALSRCVRPREASLPPPSLCAPSLPPARPSSTASLHLGSPFYPLFQGAPSALILLRHRVSASGAPFALLHYAAQVGENIVNRKVQIVWLSPQQIPSLQ